MAKIVEFGIAIACGLFLARVTDNWNWVPAIIFITLMLIAYAFLFRKPKTNV